MRAYYNANAGLQFLNSVSESAENAQINFSKFTSQMGGTDVVTYTMPDNGTFSYQLGNLTTNGVNGTYQITNLIGTVQDANDKSAYSYVIYGGGKGDSNTISYTLPPSESPLTLPRNTGIAETLNFVGDKMTGNYMFSAYKFNGGVDINGSLDYIGAGDCLDYNGGDLGLSDGTSHVCSNTCIILDGGHPVYGTVNAQTYVKIKNVTMNGDVHAGTYVEKSSGQTMTGNIYAVTDVTISNGTLVGDIYAGGNVTISGGTIDGSIYAVGNVDIGNATVKKEVISGGNVSGQQWRSWINGNVYYYGVFEPRPDSSRLGGSAIKVSTKPATPTAPTECKSYELPDYKDRTPTQLDPTDDWGIPYVIKGKSDIKDESWVFASVNLTKGGLCLDLSDENSYINIFVNGNFKLTGILSLKTSSGGGCVSAASYSDSDLIAYAKRIYLEVGGNVTFNTDAHKWVGTIFAQGDIMGKSTTSVVGTLYSKGTIDLGGGSVAYAVDSDYTK
ncbi:polymer-forming cytoskeletal protein [Desulfovibrio sp. JY]|nr:polymer-forming cytoskeletal protein [Desulfovibrio sp. JY]